MTTALVKQEPDEFFVELANVRQALAQITTVEEAKEVVDKAEAIRTYAKQVGETQETQNAIAEVKLRAIHRAGTLLQEVYEAARKQGQSGLAAYPGCVAGTTGSRWRKIAGIPEDELDEHFATLREGGHEISQRVIESLAPRLVGAGLSRSTKEDRAEAVRLRSQGMTYRAIADMFGVDDVTVYYWCDVDYRTRKRQQSREAERKRRKREVDRKLRVQVSKLPKDGLGESWNLVVRAAKQLSASIDAAPGLKDRQAREAALHSLYAAEDAIKAAIHRAATK